MQDMCPSDSCQENIQGIKAVTANASQTAAETGSRGRVLIYATTAYMIDRFNMMNISMLQKAGYTVDAACNFEFGNPMSEEHIDSFRLRLGSIGVDAVQLPLTRNIFDIAHNGRALMSTIRLMRERRYAFVHCHTPVGAVIARLACAATGTKVIYTAHGFHFFKGAPLKNWLIYYPVEKLMSYMTDVLITINKEDHETAEKHFHMKRLEYVPGIGIDMSRYSAAADDAAAVRDRQELRRELGIADDTLLILSVGELSRRKNHINVLRALAELEKQRAADPDGMRDVPNYCFCIAGTGIYKDALRRFADGNGIGDRLRLPGYRDDTDRLYRAADAFLFPSYQEGLSAALMEAMACRLPVAVSRIRGNTDLVDERGGIIFDVGKETDFDNTDNAAVDEIKAAVLKLLRLDAEERRAMGEHNYKIIRDGFSTDAVRAVLSRIYDEAGRDK